MTKPCTITQALSLIGSEVGHFSNIDAARDLLEGLTDGSVSAEITCPAPAHSDTELTGRVVANTRWWSKAWPEIMLASDEWTQWFLQRGPRVETAAILSRIDGLNERYLIELERKRHTSLPSMWDLAQVLAGIAARNAGAVSEIRDEIMVGRAPGMKTLLRILRAPEAESAAESFEALIRPHWDKLLIALRGGSVEAFGCREIASQITPIAMSSFMAAFIDTNSRTLGLQPQYCGWWTLLFDPAALKKAFPEVADRRPRGRSAVYKWEELEEWAYQRLCDEGGYSSEWLEAQLVDEVVLHFQQQWHSVPSSSSIRTHLKKSELRFNKEFRL